MCSLPGHPPAPSGILVPGAQTITLCCYSPPQKEPWVSHNSHISFFFIAFTLSKKSLLIWLHGCKSYYISQKFLLPEKFRSPSMGGGANGIELCKHDVLTQLLGAVISLCS